MASSFVNMGDMLNRIFKRFGSNNYAQSPIEEKLTSALQRFGVVVENQKQIGPFFADIYIEDGKIVVECDGEAFHQDKLKDQKRDEYMLDRGYAVLRFTGTEITKDPMKVCQRIIPFCYQEYPSYNQYLTSQSWKEEE